MESYIIPKQVIRRSLAIKSDSTTAPGSYEEMLRQARERRASTGSSSTPRQAASQPKPIPSAPQKQVTPPPAPAKKPNRQGLPFDDDMYTHLKYAIEKISSRLRSDKPLSIEELNKFETAVNAIIADMGVAPSGTSSQMPVIPAVQAKKAQLQNTPYKPPQEPRSNSKQVVENEDTTELPKAFDALRGVGSTWHVPDSDKMTTEEYYSALNQRLADVKSKLSAEGLLGTGKGDVYIEMLNSKLSPHSPKISPGADSFHKTRPTYRKSSPLAHGPLEALYSSRTTQNSLDNQQ
eukprot:gene2167-4216_t